LSKLYLPTHKIGPIKIESPEMTEVLAEYGVSVGEVVQEVDWVVSTIPAIGDMQMSSK
jgi:hypothetical protein